MPKSIIVTNVVLLTSLSVLASSGVLSVLGGDVRFGRYGVAVLSLIALGCAGVMLLTEFLTGIRWVPIVALASLVIGWVGLDGTVATPISRIAWVLGWMAVAAWFGCLAARARENRW